MSRFSGRQGKGAVRTERETKRREAEERNARTPLHRTRLYRLRTDPASELLRQIFVAPEPPAVAVESPSDSGGPAPSRPPG